MADPLDEFYAAVEKAIPVARSSYKILQRRAATSPRLKRALDTGRVKPVNVHTRPLNPAQRERQTRRHGITIRGFHGSNAAFKRPDSAKGGSSAGHRAGKEGFWSTSDRKLARTYGDMAAKRGGGKSTVLRTRTHLRRPKIYDGGGKPIYDVQRDRAFSVAVNDARRAGHDGILFRNVRDGPGRIQDVKPSNVAVSFRRKGVRIRKGRSAVASLYLEITKARGLING